MPWVYILQGSSGRHYIGSTTDLQRRLQQHASGHTHTTQRLGHPISVIASLELDDLKEARALERELKRKKNPRLALQVLKAKGGPIRSQSSPEGLRG